MATDYKFNGWLGLDSNSVKGNMVWKEYEPKPFEETDIDIQITHCGVCGSDIHTLRSGWAPTDFPVCVGHEIVGKAIKVGSKVKGIKVGDRVGVGAQSGSCLNQQGDCEACADSEESYCPHMTPTFNGKWPDGSKTYGGYADYWRGDGHFVIKIPDALPSDVAAPMLCGGVTVFSPLSHFGAGPETKVGIVGLGGLGHFGVLGAKALGVKNIAVISRTSSKKNDAFKMGANSFIATEEEDDWSTKYANTLDLIISTISAPNMPLEGYLSLLRREGTFVQVGAPEDKIPGFSAFSLLLKRVKIAGSAIGSPRVIREMLDLYAREGIHTWNVNVPLKDANKVVVDMDQGKARYRYVLVNEKHQ